ncbi:MAG: glycosyltransferase [Bacteroidetes bacterium]|nr:glycosyltransferase [Bacteroidota bacterium]
MRKKVVIVGPAHPLRGGLATFNERFARELMKECDVTLCTFKLQYPGFLFPGQTQYTDEAKPSDLQIDIALNSVNPINWVIQGWKYRKLKPDLIIFRYWMPFFGPCFGTFARIVKGNRHTRVVTIADNVIPHEKRFYDTPATRYFLKCLDGAVTMSREVLEHLKLFQFHKPAIYNPHPLYDNFGESMDKVEACKQLGLDPGEKYVLFFGFIRKYKGLDLLLEAMAHEDVNQTGVKLIVAGEFYEDAAPYHELIEKYQLKEKVILKTQFIPNPEVRTYFSACDLVVQPYRNATQSGVSQVAYHFNKPMVITDVGGLAETVPDGKTGYVVAPEPIAIAQGIARFFNNNMAGTFIANMPEAKAPFSWSVLVQHIYEVAGMAETATNTAKSGLE